MCTFREPNCFENIHLCMLCYNIISNLGIIYNLIDQLFSIILFNGVNYQIDSLLYSNISNGLSGYFWSLLNHGKVNDYTSFIVKINRILLNWST